MTSCNLGEGWGRERLNELSVLLSLSIANTTTETVQRAVTRVPKWEPGLTMGTWCQKGTQVPIYKIQKYFRGKLPKNVNFDKIIDKN